MEIKRYSRTVTSITIVDFYNNYQLGKYANLQNQPCKKWEDKKKADFIGELFKNFPTSTIHIQVETDYETNKNSYEIMGDNQDLISLLDFIEDKISLPDNFGDSPYGYEKLNSKSLTEITKLAKTDNIAQSFLNDFWIYKFPVEYFEAAKKCFLSLSTKNQLTNRKEKTHYGK